MSTQPATIFRQNYTQPPYWIETVDLTFELLAQYTQVTSLLRIKRNPQGVQRHAKEQRRRVFGLYDSGSP